MYVASISENIESKTSRAPPAMSSCRKVRKAERSGVRGDMKRAGPVARVPMRGPISPASQVRHLYKAAASITPSGKERRQRRSRVGRAGVELSTIWLQGLVQGAGHELMLFAAVGILLIGLEIGRAHV